MVLTQKMAQHFLEVDDQRIHVEDFRLQDFLPAESEQLVGKSGRPLPSLFDFLHVLNRFMAAIESIGGNLRLVAGSAQRIAPPTDPFIYR